MVAAFGLRKLDAVEPQQPTPSRGEVIARYRQLRAISKRHHSGVMKFLTHGAILHHARRLGLAEGRTIVVDQMDDLDMAMDLAIHTAPEGRSRAIDRYARSSRFAPGSDEALTLEAMQQARFGILGVERRHPSAGLIVLDLFRNVELWLVDEGLEISLPEGTAYATRYYQPEYFAMTAGVGMPIDSDLMASVLDAAPQLQRRKSQLAALEDRRFAETLYRTAVASGATAGVAHQDVPDPGEVD